MYIVCRFQIYPFEIERKTDDTVIIWFFIHFHTERIIIISHMGAAVKPPVLKFSREINLFLANYTYSVLYSVAIRGIIYI